MTNFQGSGTNDQNREQLLTWLPALLGLLVSTGIGGLLVWPQWQRLQTAQKELELLEEQQQRLPLLRSNLLKLDRNLAEAEQRSKQILELVAGSGEIQTFMAQLSEEAQLAGVQLDGYEPIVVTAPQPEKSNQSKSDKTKTPPPPPDPLLAPGLKKTSLLLVAQGDGPQLLDFLRRIERLSLLVVQSNLQVKLDTKAAPNGPAKRPELRINLSLYAPADDFASQPKKAKVSPDQS